MNSLSPVSVALIQSHLKVLGTGVNMPLDKMPGKPSEYIALRGLLDAADIGRLFLWWEYKADTKDGSCKLPDLLPSAADKPRIRSLRHGDPARDRGPVDLLCA